MSSDADLPPPSDEERPIGRPAKPPRLLIVEDDSSMRRAVLRMFRQDYEVHEAADGQEGLERARELKPAVVISDQRMPRMTGVELLTLLKDELPSAIRVLVTGFDDYGPMVDAVNAAEVHHYFEKPFHPHDLRKVVDMLVRNVALEQDRNQLLGELSRSVKQLEKINRQLLDNEARLTELVEARTSELREANDQLRTANARLREMAVRDALTGLFNRRYLIEHLELEVARSSRYDRVFSLLFADLDDFKQVNDTHGHQVGDAVLRGVGELLLGGGERLRRSDVSARYGGEEFCMLLPETPLAGAAVKAERIREAVAGLRFSEEDVPQDIAVTISIGVACYPEHGASPGDLIHAADAALYEAKRRGKNRVTEFDPQ